MRVLIIILLLLQTSLQADYKLIQSKRAKSKIDTLSKKTVADMRNIPQKTSFYAKQVTPMSHAQQMKYDKDYNKKYFSVWTYHSMHQPRQHMTWQIKFVQKRKIYDGYRRLIPKKSSNWWVQNSNFKALDTVKSHAISVVHTNFRALPTMTPIYRDPYKSTEAFPFDYNQNSELHMNVPLYISHFSKDGKWAFAKAAHAFGWVKLSDIAAVDASFMSKFKSGKYAVSVKDNLGLYRDNVGVTLVKLGTIFPYSSDKKHLLVATRTSKGTAAIKYLTIPSTSLVKTKPVKFNAKNVASISQEFYGEPYGWGGKLQTRDCSATTRDYMACFGIFLGRNSATQSKAGKSIRIKSAKGRAKKDLILQKAKPFRTLLYVPGHITLYLGRYKNEPVIMHTYWGIRMNDWSKYPLSRTIITTTEPGKEMPNSRAKSRLSNTLKTMINF